MTSAVATKSARRSRLLARIPRVLLVIMTLVLAAAGLRPAVSSPAPAGPARLVAAPADLAAQGLAERYARAYLETDPRQPEQRERALAALAGVDAASAPTSLPAREPVAVRWAAAVGDHRRGSVHRITVVAETTAGVVYLSVPIARRERGLLAVAGPPALVGGPPRDTRGFDVADDQEPVEDGALRAVSERVVRNYLAGERRNLAADLEARAVVSLPEQRLGVGSVEQVTWAVPRRVVAIDVEAAGKEDRGRALLRYELGVARRGGRWQVTAVGDRPPNRTKEESDGR